MNIQTYLDQQRQRVDQFLERSVPLLSVHPQRLCESMRYSLLGGGKRIRPILTIATAQALGYDRDAILPFAASLE
ncbi:MAG: hypothetical protein H0X47_10385, partial [Nitrospirales bacterium]|nr:hypothetical protein [Nitrospirales bacterium]